MVIKKEAASEGGLLFYNFSSHQNCIPICFVDAAFRLVIGPRESRMLLYIVNRQTAKTANLFKWRSWRFGGLTEI